MFTMQQVVASLALLAPVVAANGQPLQLSYDQGQRVVQVGANLDAEVLVLIGTRAPAAIRVNGYDILVQPRVVLPLGTFAAGDRLEFPLASETDGLGIQLVGVDLDKFQVVASGPVFFDLRDLIDRSFRARLTLTPADQDLDVRLTAPTSGYLLRNDGVDRVGDTTRVWMRLEVPGPGEIVQPALTEHAFKLKLPLQPGRQVEVHMAREVRGSPILPVYHLMATLDAFPNISE